MTEGAIFDGSFAVIDEDVRAIGDDFAVEEATVSGSSFAAFADSFELFDVFGDLEKAGGALEAAVILTEVETEAESDNWDIEINSDEGELVGLFWGQKLGFVYKHAGDVWEGLADNIVQVYFLAKTEVCFPFWAYASEEFGAVFGVGFWFNHANLMAALFVIEGDLQKLHGFTTPHCSVSEI